ncbi:hypothetical protein J6590_039891 [Homalodisca vitripennis]|nr:hypothetical protein J6590_039891 [Homalodisca vitripennis]
MLGAREDKSFRELRLQAADCLSFRRQFVNDTSASASRPPQSPLVSKLPFLIKWRGIVYAGVLYRLSALKQLMLTAVLRPFKTQRPYYCVLYRLSALNNLSSLKYCNRSRRYFLTIVSVFVQLLLSTKCPQTTQAHCSTATVQDATSLLFSLQYCDRSRRYFLTIVSVFVQLFLSTKCPQTTQAYCSTATVQDATSLLFCSDRLSALKQLKLTAVLRPYSCNGRDLCECT